MDFQQAENKFKQLRAQFKAGELIEAEFKALLEALMVQDEEGSWWMIGFETEMWYRNDGEEWVRADPPRTSSKQTKPAVSDEFVGMESERMDNVDQKISEKVTNKKEEPEATEKAKLDTTENATREKIEREGAKKAKQEQKEKAEPERKSVPVLHFKNLNDKTHEETSGQASKVTKSIASKPDRRPAWLPYGIGVGVILAFMALFWVSSLIRGVLGPSNSSPPTRLSVEDTTTEEPATPALEPTEKPTEEPVDMSPKTAMVAENPVTYRGYSTTDIPTLDPQLGEDVVSINNIENLFVNLVNVDLETTEIVPEAAASWDISEDSLTYTFHLRTDIPWVTYNADTGEVVQEADAEGNGRFVTANDFEYGIKRACDPNLGSYYSGVIAPQILGCSEVFGYEDVENIPAEMFDAIGVEAVDAETLVITLAFPASYFMSMAPMWTLAATPQWAIEEYGDQWTQAGNIVTDGRYVVASNEPGVSRTLLSNPLMPADLAGSGNVERLITNVVPDVVTGYGLWLNNEVEVAGIPDEELENHLAEFPDETVQVPDLAVFYIAFRMTKPPFDDARVRRAFSAAFDRETYVSELLQGQGLPMKHFAPPGIFGAPPIDEVGVGYDPEFAAAQLADAGYPNCEGFPTVTLLGHSGQSTLNWIEYAQAQWETNLGCSADLIQIEQQPFAELLPATDASVPDEEAPSMWTLAWGPDYGDENNWVGDVMYCENATPMKRSCNEIDDMIVQAREESDPATRVQLYREIEDDFFGPEGEMPFFPVYLHIAYQAEHSWFQWTPGLFGGQQFYNYYIDVDAQSDVRGN